MILTYFRVRIREKLESGTMAVAGDQWPLLVYEKQEYDEDDPWRGLFRSRILVLVGVYFPYPHFLDVFSLGRS